MKKIILVFSVLLNLTLGFSQDTIFVSDVNTTYLIFPKTVDLLDVGNPTEYYGKIEDKAVLLKAVKTNTNKSTLLVRSGEAYFHYLVMYHQEPKKYYYDYSKTKDKTTETIEEVKADETGGTAPSVKNLKNMQGKVDSIVNIKGENKTLGVLSDFLQAAVTVIRNDKENTYLKVVIKNLSSIPYKFDFIGFQYFQVMKKGFMNKTKNAPLDVFPIIYPKSGEISANSTAVVGYAIPQFGLANNGYLVVSFREKTGDRVLKIRIDSGLIQSAKYFNY